MSMTKVSSPVRRTRSKLARDSSSSTWPESESLQVSQHAASQKQNPGPNSDPSSPRASNQHGPVLTSSFPSSSCRSIVTSNREPPSCVEKPLKDPQADRLAQYHRQAVPNLPRSLEGEKLNQYDSTQLQQPDSVEPRGDVHPSDMSHLDLLCTIAGLDRQQHDLVVNDKNALAQINLRLLAKLVVSKELCTVLGERISRLEALLDVETDGRWRDIEKEQATRKDSLKRRVEDWLRGIQEA